MEALVAVGFAANILQFVDYVSHLLNIGSQLRRQGISDFNSDLERSATLLKHQTLEQLAKECIEIADEIVSFVSKFKVKQYKEPDVQIVPKSRPKHPDEERLEKLKRPKPTEKEELRTIQQREKSKWRTVKNRLEAANQKALETSNILRAANTLAKAVQLEWNKSKITDLAHKLDRMRNMLYSEVMLNIQNSVNTIQERSNHSNQLLGEINESAIKYRDTSTQSFQESRQAVEFALQAQSDQILQLNDSEQRRHDIIIQTINAFTEVLQSKILFPGLPSVLTRIDPSLKSAALNGYETIENAILAALYFRKMEDREAQVQDAHSKTFEWIFEKPEDHDKPWSNFSEWLEIGRGCYWVGGKAGCGKSTLMKFLNSHPRARESLEKWNQPASLVTASCYFWMAGTPLQKNQEGLLRSLLHTILWQRRDLISRVFPRQYDAMMAKIFADNSDPEIFFLCDVPGCSSSFEKPRQLVDHQQEQHTRRPRRSTGDDCGSLTVTELKRALLTLAQQDFKNDLKICLFIDGLDEFVGDQREVIELFRTVTKHPSIKAIISSRPESTFVEAFINAPKLLVEDLTAGDIKHYVNEKLLSHSQLKSHAEHDPELAERLNHSIISKASGVFLWVVLVVQALQKCLTDGSYPEELEGFIEDYPSELHDFYEDMFERMNPMHRLEAFRLLQAVFLVQNVESAIPSGLRLSLFDRDEVTESIQRPLTNIPIEELRSRLSVFQSRLRSRCCGLLEMHYDRTTTSRSDSLLVEGRVAFLHRTVSDFLKQQDIRDRLEKECLMESTEIYEKLLGSILSRLKVWGFFRLRTSVQWQKYVEEIKIFLVYCQRCESHLGSRQIGYLDELNRVLERLRTTRASEGALMFGSERHWAESLLSEAGLKINHTSDGHSMLSLAARYGLYTYVHASLASSPTSSDSNISGIGIQNLVLGLCNWAIQHGVLRTQHMRMVEHFLEAGFDVNADSIGSATILGRTPWGKLLYLAPSSLLSYDMALLAPFLGDTMEPVNEKSALDERVGVWVRLLQLFIKFGADLQVQLESMWGIKRGAPKDNVVACIRKAVDALMEAGFEANPVSRAMREAGVGYDVPALATWIMDEATPNIETPRVHSKPSPTKRLPGKEVLPAKELNTQMRSPESSARQWSTVTKKKNLHDHAEVVGACYIINRREQRIEALK
ncbi:hypothetical protein LHYA1_G000648 [Lachnellula hyalina]|uniref:C2H2-type domain-containing protein n=1 Tax=Lachnellula hyalina TaxID=1316788 RepID=A0A8H8U4I6_9HELO|nr:uncharacterized protein LHYA1_G000648 [Lachnellula hyalina]TVY30238.1 hypothetical protein LHYA1_G000648 [Lachnellula hyalina]